MPVILVFRENYDIYILKKGETNSRYMIKKIDDYTKFIGKGVEYDK